MENSNEKTNEPTYAHLESLKYLIRNSNVIVGVYKESAISSINKEIEEKKALYVRVKELESHVKELQEALTSDDSNINLEISTNKSPSKEMLEELESRVEKIENSMKLHDVRY